MTLSLDLATPNLNKHYSYSNVSVISVEDMSDDQGSEYNGYKSETESVAIKMQNLEIKSVDGCSFDY
jgi:hypothetical protein